MRDGFDIKTKDLITWNGQIVMSRTEAPALKEVIQLIPLRRPESLLEVGFGLGVSAKLIQKIVKPRQHDIVELNESIFNDLDAYARSKRNIEPIFGDFWCFKNPRRYDIIFFDPFDYEHNPAFGGEGTDDSHEKAERMSTLLVDGGIVCCPELGPGEPEPMPGFKKVLYRVFETEPFLFEDGSMSTRAGIVCWRK